MTSCSERDDCDTTPSNDSLSRACGSAPIPPRQRQSGSWSPGEVERVCLVRLVLVQVQALAAHTNADLLQMYQTIGTHRDNLEAVRGGAREQCDGSHQGLGVVLVVVTVHG